MISIKIIICFSYLFYFMCNYILYRSFIAVWIIINKIYLNITRKHNFLKICNSNLYAMTIVKLVRKAVFPCITVLYK